MPHPLAQRRLYDDSGPRCATLELIEKRTQSAFTQDQNAARPNHQLHVPQFIRSWHLSSLDAPTVAFVWCVAFAWTCNVQLPWWVLVLIPLGVWAVYIADRLLDARTAMQSSAIEQLRDRHIFHWRHRRILAPAALASALVAAWIILNLMPRTTREHDSLLAAASLLYFTRVHSGRRFFPVFSKEFLVGFLFTFGCAFPAFSRADFSHELARWPLLIVVVCFALLAWLNCYAIDRWETHRANASHQAVALHALFLAAACLIGTALLAEFHPRPAALLACAASAALLLAILDRARNRLTPITLRAAADLALLTPAMLLSLAPLFRK